MRRAAGWALVALGLALVALMTLQLGLADHHTGEAQEQLVTEVPDGRSGGDCDGVPVAEPVAAGAAFVEMRIPRLGDDWHWTAVEGTTPEALEDGPGHYAGSALPGQRGNSAFAAHRAGHGDPFIDFDRLRTGDLVELSQGRTAWVYELVTGPQIIPVTADWVLDRVDGRALTLTTCWPKYGSDKRMYVRGELVRVSVDGRTVYTSGPQGP